MDVSSTELEIRLSFIKTSEFRGGGGFELPKFPHGAPLVHEVTYLMYCQVEVSVLV
jgi:hypothetical protein